MRHVTKAAWISLALAAALLGGCAGDATAPEADSQAALSDADPPELTIAIAGMVTPKEGLDYYLDLAKYVGAKAGKPVHLIHKSDYAQVNTMLEEGKVDVAFVCSGPYVAGHDAFDLELLAAPVVNGQPAYNSYVIVPSSSEATSFESLRGLIFAFADPESNTGHTVPVYMLEQMGEEPEVFFAETFYTYSHDNSIKAVASGDADGAAVDSLIWEYQNATNPRYTSRTRILLTSEDYAIPPVVVRPGLDPNLVAELRKAFLSADEDPEGAALLGHMNIEEFVTIEDSAYDSIREMNEVIGK